MVCLSHGQEHRRKYPVGAVRYFVEGASKVVRTEPQVQVDGLLGVANSFGNAHSNSRAR